MLPSLHWQSGALACVAPRSPSLLSLWISPCSRCESEKSFEALRKKMFFCIFSKVAPYRPPFFQLLYATNFLWFDLYPHKYQHSKWPEYSHISIYLQGLLVWSNMVPNWSWQRYPRVISITQICLYTVHAYLLMPTCLACWSSLCCLSSNKGTM